MNDLLMFEQQASDMHRCFAQSCRICDSHNTSCAPAPESMTLYTLMLCSDRAFESCALNVPVTGLYRPQISPGCCGAPGSGAALFAVAAALPLAVAAAAPLLPLAPAALSSAGSTLRGGMPSSRLALTALISCTQKGLINADQTEMIGLASEIEV